MDLGLRIVGAPISWGVSEVPGWGHQLSADRVLGEAASLGLTAIEAGPEGFLPANPEEAAALLARYGLGLVGGFVPAVLHSRDLRPSELEKVDRQARLFASVGADVLVIAASSGQHGYDEAAVLDADAWAVMFESLPLVEEIGARHGLSVVLHPHFGTAIERSEHVLRLLEGSEIGICLDTGHLAVGGADPIEILRLAAGRVRHAHLKDVDARLAEQVSMGVLGYEAAVHQGLYRPLGKGDVDIERAVELLQSAGYRGWYVLEQDVALEDEPAEGEGPVIDIRESLAFLTRELRTTADA